MGVNDALIQLRGAQFKYGERSIFSDVDLEVGRGEVLAILGPNGCGKSTLLRCLGGDLELSQGSASLAGQEISRLSPMQRARKIGFLFQDHVPTFPFTVLDVAIMGRTPHLAAFSSPSSADRMIADAALERMGIAHLRSRAYTELSGGERQLVLLARTLVQQPQVILLDEPTAHLDLKNQVRCLQIIGALAREGITMIMTSHDPNQAFQFSGRVALKSLGGGFKVGASQDVLTEASLSAAYGTDIGVYEVADGQRTLKFCSPRHTG
jgi:iron complex transport system ATP-binding protein